MLLYVKVNDNNEIIGRPMNIYQLRKEFPNVSLPEKLTSSDAAALKCKLYYDILPNQTLEQFETFEEITPMFKNDVYYRTWKKVDVSWNVKQQIISNKWKEIREKRNQLLRDSDWMVLPDSPLTEEEKKRAIEQRKRLRDITKVDNPFYISFADITFE